MHVLPFHDKTLEKNFRPPQYGEKGTTADTQFPRITRVVDEDSSEQLSATLTGYLNRTRAMLATITW